MKKIIIGFFSLLGLFLLVSVFLPVAPAEVSWQEFAHISPDQVFIALKGQINGKNTVEIISPATSTPQILQNITQIYFSSPTKIYLGAQEEPLALYSFSATHGLTKRTLPDLRGNIDFLQADSKEQYMLIGATLKNSVMYCVAALSEHKNPPCLAAVQFINRQGGIQSKALWREKGQEALITDKSGVIFSFRPGQDATFARINPDKEAQRFAELTKAIGQTKNIKAPQPPLYKFLWLVLVRYENAWVVRRVPWNAERAWLGFESSRVLVIKTNSKVSLLDVPSNSLSPLPITKPLGDKPLILKYHNGAEEVTL